MQHWMTGRAESWRRSGLVLISMCGATYSAVAQPCEPQWDGIIGQPGIVGGVRAIMEFDGGVGPAVYAAGGFHQAGGKEAHGIARWDGEEWFPLGSGIPELLGGGTAVRDLEVFDAGSGPALYVGGTFWKAGGVETNGLARWTGSQWSAVEGWEYGDVSALTVFDDGSGEALYVAGGLSAAAGVGVARWDGQTWSGLGGGISPEPGTTGVDDLAVFDDGAGPALYATGQFSMAGGISANRIAKWDGSAWTPLGSGVGEPLPEYAFTTALEVFDDGSGPALYVCGYFTVAGGVPVSSIAKWDGEAWSDVGGGFDPGIPGTVYDLEVFDDGSGPALFATGFFDVAGAVEANGIAKWDGSQWSVLAGPGGEAGLNPGGTSLRALRGQSALAVGGSFGTAGGIAAGGVALWQGCPTCYADCDGSGELDVFDFLCFQDQFAAGSLEADCDGSGGLDVFDFLCFQNEFAAGCP